VPGPRGLPPSRRLVTARRRRTGAGSGLCHGGPSRSLERLSGMDVTLGRPIAKRNRIVSILLPAPSERPSGARVAGRLRCVAARAPRWGAVAAPGSAFGLPTPASGRGASAQGIRSGWLSRAGCSPTDRLGPFGPSPAGPAFGRGLRSRVLATRLVPRLSAVSLGAITPALDRRARGARRRTDLRAPPSGHGGLCVQGFLLNGYPVRDSICWRSS
jgi:hypothetical protein